MTIKTNVTRKGDAKIDIEVEIPVEHIQEQYKKEMSRFRSDYKMPGFRPGKVPEDIIEKKYKPQIQGQVVEALASEAYSRALREHQLMPYSSPSFNEFDMNMDKPLNFTISVEVYPSLKLSNYKGLSVHKDTVKIAKDDLDKQIESIRQKHTELVPREGAVEMDNVAVLDMVGYDGEKELTDSKLTNYRAEVKKDVMPEDMLKGLIGMKKDEEKEIKVKYPKDYFNKNMAGKEIRFEVKLQDVLEKKVPALDDELAKDEGEKSLDELKKKIEEGIRKEAEYAEQRIMDDKILQEIIKHSKFDIPSSLLEKQADQHFQDMQNQLKYRNLTLESFYAIEKTNEEKVKAGFRDRAVREVQDHLIIREVASKEELKVPEEEYEAELKSYAQRINQPESEVRKYFEKSGENNYIRSGLLFKKVMEFLRSQTTARKGKNIKFADIAGR